MKVRTITGPSIHAALAEARRLLGDDVVLLESIPPKDGQPARISVLADDPVPAPAPVPSAPAAPAPAPTAPGGYGYAALRRPPANALPGEENTPRAERFSPVRADVVPTVSGGDGAPTALPAAAPPRGRLFPEDPRAAQPANPPPAPAVTDHLARLFEAQLGLLHERLERMERRLDDAVVGASQQWIAHPLFSALLKQGMRPGTVAGLFDHLAAKGYAPDLDEQKLRWLLANALRERLSLPAARQSNGTQLFIGPGGAGKTALVLKLATHPSFYARRKTTVIAIGPEEEDALPYQNPVDLYRRFGIPVQSVRTEEEMAEALGRLKQFDQVLIDTPPMPVHQGGARRMLQRVRRLVDSLMPLEVQFVLNTTRVLDGFDAAYLERMPLRPTALALTHLDETPGWGRVAEWLMALKLPVQFASTGPRTPDDLAGFSPSWFVESMLKL